jgi:RNA polymerase sigma-70 factor, ECF subfamily
MPLNNGRGYMPALGFGTLIPDAAVTKIAHLNSGAFSEAHPGNPLATGRSNAKRCQQLLGGTAMNCTDRDLLIDITDKLAARRDDQLVKEAQAGLPGAFAELYATYSPRLYKTILSITRNPEDAEDALQNTFLRVHFALHTFEGRSGIYSWLTRIAINSALMILRRRRTRPETLFDPHSDPREDTPCFEIKDSSPNPEQICDLRQRRIRVLHAIRNLDPRLQTPIRMQMTMGSSVKEIGCALNISQAAVKARLHRARRRLFVVGDVKRPELLHQSVDLTRFAEQTIMETSNRS